MAKFSLMFHRKDCMGCHACEVACKQEHHLSIGPRLVRVVEKSADFFPVYCHHCADAPCRASCPVEAIYRNEKGLVLIDSEKCIGCKECMEACPFGAMQFDDDAGTAVKCDLCAERLYNGLSPACFSVCPTRCIAWGNALTLSETILRASLPRKMK